MSSTSAPGVIFIMVTGEDLQELSENWVSDEQLLFLHALSIIHIVALTAETRVVCAGRSVLILTNRCRCCPLGRESKC